MMEEVEDVQQWNLGSMVLEVASKFLLSFPKFCGFL